MSLKTKAPLFIGLLIVSVFTMLTTLYTFIMYRGFLTIEQNLISQNITRTDESIKRELEYLVTKSADWAVWDDTYNFISTRSKTFIDINMNPASLLAINVNAMAFFSNKDGLFYSYWVNPDGSEATAPATFEREMKNLHDKIICTAEPQKKSGILTFPEGSLFFASRPVVKSNGEGPVDGTILLGFWFNSERVANVQKIVNLPLTIFPATPDTSAHTAIFAQVNKNGRAIVRKDIKTIAGYGHIDDITGIPAFYYEVDMPRSIFQQGIQSILGLLAIEIIVCIVFISVSYFGMNRLILDRLLTLTHSVTQIGEEGKPISTIPEDNAGDEISSLARSINTMLTSLEKTRKETEDSKLALVAKQKEMEQLNTFMVGREVAMADLKKQIEALNAQLNEAKAKGGS